MGMGLGLESQEEIDRLASQNRTDPGFVGAGAPAADAPAADAPAADAPAVEDEIAGGKRKIGDVLTSDNWLHFTRGPILADKKSYYAFCKYCPKKYLVGRRRSTTSMQNHWEKGCKKIPRGKRYQLEPMQMLLKASKTEGGNKLAGWVFDQMTSRKSLARMVIAHDYPFNCVKHHFLKVFLADLQPSFKVPSRNTLRTYCINVYKEEQGTLYDQFGMFTCRFSFTSDLWTNKGRDRGFMALTCHYIDDTWKLRKRVIAFSPLESSHTGLNIAEAIYDRLVSWNMDKNVFCLVLDNVTSNDAAVRELLKTSINEGLPVSGNIFHQRCGCHILNLFVQDGLEALSDEIKNIRETMIYIRHSQARMEKFRHATAQAKIPYKKPIWDVPTRWNSTYKMLQVALLIKPAIYRLAIIDKRYLKNPSELEWEAISVLVQELKIYYDVTLKLSGTKYSTINLFFVEFCEVYLAIKNMSTSAYPFVVEMGKNMETKFEKYWKIGNVLLALGCVFDPRCKLGVVQYYLKKLYPAEHDELVSNVKCCMNALFQEYEGGAGSEVQTQAVTSNSSLTSASVTDTRAGLKDFIRGMKDTDPKKSELEDYLSSPLDEASLDEGFDILAWWKLKVPRYPMLSRLARDILAVPIFTVASESAFSNSGRTLSPVRSCLSDESIEALLCAQDWLQASIDESGGQFGDTIWTTDEDLGTVTIE